MNLAVAGASGFVGRALVRRLAAGGHTVLRLVRRPAERPDELRWYPTSGEVEQHERLDGMEALVNLAGCNLAGGLWTPARREAIRRSRVEATRNLVAVATHLNHRPRVLVSASAVGYYGSRGDAWLTEASPHGAGFLAEVCRDWEAEARIAEDLGVRVVRLRLGVVLGAGGGMLGRLQPLFRAGLGGRLGHGRQWMSWISLDDLLGVIERALSDEGLRGPVNAVAPQPVRNAEFTAALAAAVRRPAWFRAPAWALRLGLQDLADELLLSSARVRPQRLLDLGFSFRHPTLAEALDSAIHPRPGEPGAPAPGR